MLPDGLVDKYMQHIGPNCLEKTKSIIQSLDGMSFLANWNTIGPQRRNKLVVATSRKQNTGLIILIRNGLTIQRAVPFFCDSQKVDAVKSFNRIVLNLPDGESNHAVEILRCSNPHSLLNDLGGMMCLRRNSQI